MAQIIVHFLCRHCGGSTLQVPDDKDEDSEVNCGSCGAKIGTWGFLSKLWLSGQMAGDQDRAVVLSKSR
jgi:DNA-directed RNA polymerase subunit RPC12/RpoP